MIKKNLGLNAKEYLKLKEKDRMTFFTLADNQIRGAYLHGTLMVRQAAANHETGPLETLILGQALVSGALLSSTLKGDDRVQIVLKTDGCLGGFSVDSNAYGEVRGYLYQNPIRVPQEWTELDMQAVWGKGFFTVNKFITGKSAPFSGTIETAKTGLADTLIHYFDKSEQIPTAVILSLPFDREGNVRSAAGMILQSLPGCPQEVWNSAASRLYEIPSIGENAEADHDPIKLLDFWFSDLGPENLGSRRYEFLCPCTKDRFAGFLLALPEKDRQELMMKGPYPLETHCHNCNSVYYFTQKELVELMISKN